MKLTIKDVNTEPNERMTSQTLWNIKGDIDGKNVLIQYLDCGNNAEYDTKTELRMSYPGVDYDDVFGYIGDWLWDNEGNLSDMKSGDSFKITDIKQPAPPTLYRPKPPKM